LLRVLEDRSIMRVGGAEVLQLDFRLIAATNRDLEQEVSDGRFREDLYYRLKVVTIEVPPLRRRIGDLALLAETFLDRLCVEHGRSPKRLSQSALEILAGYGWPGNVRELRNVLESLVIFHQGEEITSDDLPLNVRERQRDRKSSGSIQNLVGEPIPMAEIERRAILETLELTGGKRAEAATILDIGLRTLQRKLKEYREAGTSEI